LGNFNHYSIHNIICQPNHNHPRNDQNDKHKSFTCKTSAASRLQEMERHQHVWKIVEGLWYNHICTQ
jgi:hypothetical protein